MWFVCVMSSHVWHFLGFHACVHVCLLCGVFGVHVVCVLCVVWCEMCVYVVLFEAHTQLP